MKKYSKTPFIATPVYRNSRLLQLVSPVYRNKLYHFFLPLISRRSGHVILKDRREYPSLLNLWCIYLYEFSYIREIWNISFIWYETIVYVYIATYLCFICNRKIYKFFTFQCILLWQIIAWIVPSTAIALPIANQLFYKMREYFYWKKFNHAFENYERNM